MNSACLVFFLAFGLVHAALYNFKTSFQWTQIEYEFESEVERNASIANGTFAIGKVQPIDVQLTNVKSLKGGDAVTRYFVTTPRINASVPFSLSVITNKSINGNPVIQPYPHPSWHINPKQCNEKRIVSAFRVWLDECERLWVIDNGFVGLNDLVCNPQLLAFDLATDELVQKYEIPQSIHKNTSDYHTIIAEVLNKNNSCLDTWIYGADTVTPSLLVYSLKLNQSWSVKDATFEADPKWSNITVVGNSFSGAYGLISLALSPTADGDKRKLAYHALANIKESYVYTNELRNISLLGNGGGNIFHTYEKSRNQQSDIEAYDSEGRLHFTLLIDTQIARWAEKKEYAPENFEIVADDAELLQFPTSIKIGNDAQNKESIIVFTTRLQNWWSGKISPNETNFRVLFTNLLD